MRLKLRFKRKSQNENVIWFIVVMPFLFGFLNEMLHFPSAIRYLLDLAWIFLFLTMLVKPKGVKNAEMISFLKWIILFVGYSFILYVANYQSALYYLWGFRNNFRFYVFFLACVIYLKSDYVENYLDWFDRLFYINVAVVIIQYFLLGKQGDYLGGIFGVQQGCNAYLNIFQVIIVTKCILYCLNKRERFHSCAFKCAMALVIAAFAELKFFFFEFVLIVMIAILITNFSWRKLLIILGSIVAVYGAGIVLVRLFPNFADSMSIHGLLKIATSDKGYTSVGDMNRLTVIPMSNRLFLKNDIQRLFGFGLGNCDYATGYSFLTTPFYRRNSWTHYMWLSTASIYLEMGIVGLFFFFGFFVMVFFKVHKNQKKAQTDIVYYQMTKIMAIMGGVIAIYNSSMKTEAAYMLYFMLTLPFLKSKSV